MERGQKVKALERACPTGSDVYESGSMNERQSWCAAKHAQVSAQSEGIGHQGGHQLYPAFRGSMLALAYVQEKHDVRDGHVQKSHIHLLPPSLAFCRQPYDISS